MQQRSTLLDRATQALAARPTATMDDIAASVGVSRATLFRHFASRDALVAELCSRAADLYTSAVEAARPEDGPPAEALRRVAAGVAGLGPAHGLLALQALPDDIEAELLDAIAGADERLRGLVVRGQEAGELRADLPADWVITALTWLTVGAADGLRLGVLAARDVERLVVETVMAAVLTGAPHR